MIPPQASPFEPPNLSQNLSHGWGLSPTSRHPEINPLVWALVRDPEFILHQFVPFWSKIGDAVVLLARPAVDDQATCSFLVCCFDQHHQLSDPLAVSRRLLARSLRLGRPLDPSERDEILLPALMIDVLA